MSRVSTARRIARAAAYGGGGLGVAGAMFTGLLRVQAELAKRAIPAFDEDPPVADGRYGTAFGGVPLQLVVLGDSSAAGLGVDLPAETPGALLATGLAGLLERPVDLRCHAVCGAVSAGLGPQVIDAVASEADLAVMMIGGNDVTHLVRPQTAVRHLVDAVGTLRDHGLEVVVGTCPDLGTIRPIPPPLRWFARRMSRQLAAAQTIAVVQAGGRTVSLGDLLGPEFAAAPDKMFSADRFHPSAAGYAAAIAAVLPTAAAAVGAIPEGEPSASRGEWVRSLPEAAVAAATQPGTEVTATEVAGAQRGPWGQWAQLRRRVRHLAWPRPAARGADEARPAEGVS